MIEIMEDTSPEALAVQRNAYLATLVAPLDGMWEAFASMARIREVRSSGRRIGYFCVNDEGKMLQFFLEPSSEHLAADVFASTLARDEVTGAMVSTADPLFLGLCLDAQKRVRVHTLLYRDDRREPGACEGADDLVFDLVRADELEEVVALQRAALDQDPGEWLIGYLRNLIARRQLHALRRGSEILGTGETRVSESQLPFVDLGMITMRAHRGKGVATDILCRLRKLCYGRDLAPICSTTVENVGARRAIARAGFFSRHRILEMTFRGFSE